MNTKIYLPAATALGIAALLAVAAPAFAASVNVPVNQEEQGEAANGHAPGWDEGGPGRVMAQRAPGIFGTVASVSGTTLTVTSKMPQRGEDLSGAIGAPAATTYTVDAANATVFKNSATSTLSAVAAGDTVMVQGTVSGTNVTATAIHDGLVPRGEGGAWGAGRASAANPIIQGNGQPIIGGSITAINGTTLTVTNKSNVTYTVDAANAAIVKGNATSTLSAVATGDSVIVQGAVNGSSVTASSVMDQGAAASANDGSLGHRVIGFFAGIGGFFAHLFGF